MDSIWPVVEHPFMWGLVVGLVVAAFVGKGAWTARTHARREIARLRGEIDQLQKHLQSHLKITASGNERLEGELADLRTQNENLRVNLAASQQRPGRAEIRQLQIYDAAVARVREQAPGFAASWEQALRQATAETDAAEKGFARLVRKIIPGATSASIPAEPTPPLIGLGESPASRAPGS